MTECLSSPTPPEHTIKKKFQLKKSNHRYFLLLAADRSPERARELRRLVRALPDAHYETLKYLIQHLRRVVAHSAYNKMEARNLAIVFGPTLVRAASDDMLAMVNDMSSQCRIIESFLTHVSAYLIIIILIPLKQFIWTPHTMFADNP